MVELLILMVLFDQPQTVVFGVWHSLPCRVWLFIALVRANRSVVEVCTSKVGRSNHSCVRVN